jgi:hypothetical protein
MLLERMLRAARLDPELYYEVRRDSRAGEQALYVLLLNRATSVMQPV